VTDTRLLQSIAWAAPHMPSAPPIQTALVRNIVRAVRLKLVFVFIQMPPSGAYARELVRTAAIPIVDRAQLAQADVLVSFIGQGQSV
jgi:hypothetical protein